MNLSLKPECLKSTTFRPDFSEMELEKKKLTYIQGFCIVRFVTDKASRTKFTGEVTFFHTWYSYKLIAGSTATNLKLALATKADRQVSFAWN